MESQIQEIEEVRPEKKQKRKRQEIAKSPNGESPKLAFAPKKLDLETAKALQTIKDRINKKTFGRKIKDTEIIAKALSLLSADHLKELQEATLTEKDRLAIAHEEFQKTNGKITLDQFIGKLLRGEISPKTLAGSVKC